MTACSFDNVATRTTVDPTLAAFAYTTSRLSPDAGAMLRTHAVIDRGLGSHVRRWRATIASGTRRWGFKVAFNTQAIQDKLGLPYSLVGAHAGTLHDDATGNQSGCGPGRTPAFAGSALTKRIEHAMQSGMAFAPVRRCTSCVPC